MSLSSLTAPLASPLAALPRMRLQIEAAVLRRLDAGAGLGEPRPSGVYVRGTAAMERLAGGTLRPQGSHRKAAAAVEAELQAARQRETGEAGDGGGDRLALAARRFGLDALGRDLLLLATAFELDPDSRDLLHALAGRRRNELTVELCADVLDGFAPHQLAEALAPGAALRESRLLLVEGDGLGGQLSLRSHALRWLCGDDGVPAALQQLATLHAKDRDLGVALPEATELALDALLPLLARRPSAEGSSDAPVPLVTLRGPRGSGRLAAAHRLARARDQALLAVTIPPLLAAEKQRRAALLPDVLAIATLLDAAVYLAEIDAMWDESGSADLDHVAVLRRHRGLIAVGSAGRGGHVDVQRPSVVVPMTRAALDDRERSWRHALARHAAAANAEPLGEALAAELAGRYVIGPGAIAEVVAEAGSYAAATSSTVSRDSLEAAVGRRLSLRLGTFGSVVARKSRFSELILPDEVVDTLRDLLAMVRERSLILEKWGFQRHLGISRGVSALFSGEPGTGKTMAASVLASELGLELVRIDLSAVVSKFVGETEKNLSRIFDEAQDAHAMLLFDEADSLFGKRTELKSAQDRFANLEVNYILQRMETFDGISVLTTNAENAIDPALQRRLNFRIRFPEPEQEERERLWRALLPPAAGVGEIDFGALAERFEMTGGYIKNAVVRAAVIAARAGRSLSAEDLWSGAHHEYAEMGKVMPQLPMPGETLMNVMHDDDGGPVRHDARLTSVALCLVAATLLTAACMSKRWLANGSGPDSIGYGLIRFTECIGGACQTHPSNVEPIALTKRLPREQLSPVFPLAGWTTMGASALAIVALVACALIGLFRQRLALPIAPSSLALLGLLVAMIAGSLFIATKPGGLGRVGVDWSFVVFSAAVVIGMVAAQRISKEIRPIDPELEALDQMMNGG